MVDKIHSVLRPSSWRKKSEATLLTSNGNQQLETNQKTTGPPPYHPEAAAYPPVKLAVLGCGQRGKAYAAYALLKPLDCQVVSIAEPREQTRQLFAARHATTIDPSFIFTGWKEFVAASIRNGEKLCDAVIVAVQDHMHAEVVLSLAKLGYDILCEKPMATSTDDCFRIYDAVTDTGIIFGMGHVMRYSPYSKAITSIIESGQLGNLVNAVQIEPVGYYHFAHSYVRGNWHSEKESSFSLMTKCCHDIDLLCRWMLPAKPIRISSFGSLSHFRKDAKPHAAGDAIRCLECPVQNECPYSAKTSSAQRFLPKRGASHCPFLVYLESTKRGNIHWPVAPLVDGIPDIESVTQALQTGPYGVCVYEAPNDVVDHQVVAIEYSTGATVSFTMVAFTDDICDRKTHLHFSHGEIIGNMQTFTTTDFRTASDGHRRTQTHRPPPEGGGHGGGDVGLISSFVNAVRLRDQTVLGTSAREVLDSHLTVFAAEKARKEGKVVHLQDFERDVRAQYERLKSQSHA